MVLEQSKNQACLLVASVFMFAVFLFCNSDIAYASSNDGLTANQRGCSYPGEAVAGPIPRCADAVTTTAVVPKTTTTSGPNDGLTANQRGCSYPGEAVAGPIPRCANAVTTTTTTSADSDASDFQYPEVGYTEKFFPKTGSNSAFVLRNYYVIDASPSSQVVVSGPNDGLTANQRGCSYPGEAVAGPIPRCADAVTTTAATPTTTSGPNDGLTANERGCSYPGEAVAGPIPRCADAVTTTEVATKTDSGPNDGLTPAQRGCAYPGEIVAGPYPQCADLVATKAATLTTTSGPNDGLTANERGCSYPGEAVAGPIPRCADAVTEHEGTVVYQEIEDLYQKESKEEVAETLSEEPSTTDQTEDVVGDTAHRSSNSPLSQVASQKVSRRLHLEGGNCGDTSYNCLLYRRMKN